MYNFEETVFLFNCTDESRDIIRLNLDEGAYLYSITNGLENARVLEVGRFRGGSTILLAAALGEGSTLESVDLRPRNDKFVVMILDNLKLTNVELIRNDIHNLDLKDKYDLIFIDGNHTYEGIQKDFEKLKDTVKVSGSLVFHDYASNQPDVMKYIDEVVKKDKQSKLIKQVSSLMHFVRID